MQHVITESFYLVPGVPRYCKKNVHRTNESRLLKEYSGKGIEVPD